MKADDCPLVTRHFVTSHVSETCAPALYEQRIKREAKLA